MSQGTWNTGIPTRTVDEETRVFSPRAKPRLLSLLPPSDQSRSSFSLFAPNVEQSQTTLNLFPPNVEQSQTALTLFPRNVEQSQTILSLFPPNVEQTQNTLNLFPRNEKRQSPLNLFPLDLESRGTLDLFPLSIKAHITLDLFPSSSQAHNALERFSLTEESINALGLSLQPGPALEDSELGGILPRPSSLIAVQPTVQPSCHAATTPLATQDIFAPEESERGRILPCQASLIASQPSCHAVATPAAMQDVSAPENFDLGGISPRRASLIAVQPTVHPSCHAVATPLAMQDVSGPEENLSSPETGAENNDLERVQPAMNAILSDQGGENVQAMAGSPSRRQAIQPRNARQRPVKKSSIYTGVTHYKRTGRWEAHIWHNVQIYLGASRTEIQAGRAYDRALIHFRGPGAKGLNFNMDDYARELQQLQKISSDDLVAALRKQSAGAGRPMPIYPPTMP